MSDFTNISYDHLDRLERIYSRVSPRSSAAALDMANENFNGGASGKDETRLTTLDYLSAIGAMERDEPLGGCLLRALLTGCNQKMIDYVTAKASRIDFKGQTLLNRNDLRIFIVCALSEFLAGFTSRSCHTCKGVGLLTIYAPPKKCKSCQGSGLVRDELKPFTRFRLMSDNGVSFGRKKWENRFQDGYLELIRAFNEHMNAATLNLFDRLKSD